MQEGDGFSVNPLEKPISFANRLVRNGPAGQFWQMEGAFTLALKQSFEVTRK